MYQATHGTPRLINVVCDNCLLLGFVKETRRITPEMVRQVLEDMVPSFAEPEQTDTGNGPRLSLAA